jgi:hypothetical protein
VHGVPGVADKQPALKIDRELVGPVAGLEVELVGGAPSLNEAVVFHPPSGALVCADFLFNFVPATFATRVVLAIVGAGGELRQSRVWWFAVRDRAAARASIDRILRWPIARVVPVHGEPCEIDAAGLAPRLSRAYGGAVTTRAG